MHEFSFALNIVNIAVEHAVKANASKVLTLEIDVGKLSGIQVHALESAIKTTIKDTLLHGAEVKIYEIEGKARCKKCQTLFGTEEVYCACPNCKSFENELVQGQELRVRSIEVE
jgi:hydrogenase nickel incorporation protein HypA/HybF